MNEIFVTLDFTPNPKTIKYVVNRELVSTGAFNFKTIKDAKEGSELAMQLLSIPGVEAVMIGKNFVTITLVDEDQALSVNAVVPGVITEHLTKGIDVIKAGYTQASPISGGTDQEKMIMEILENEIRPAVAMDGGDITFDRYEDGILYLQMKGSCSGCPSSTATLKDGIESRMRQLIPDLKEVVSV